MRVHFKGRVKQAVRRGFTLIEMLVVIVIIGIIASMLLPAINGAREQARRSRCAANMKQIGLAILNFEASKGMLPSGGQGTDLTKAPPVTVFDNAAGQSVFMQILPYMDRMDLVNQYNMGKRYNDSNTAANQVVAKTVIDSYLCPSDPFPNTDQEGYGRLDYMATVYSDVNHDATAQAPPAQVLADRMNGAMAVPACPLSGITDGASTTIFCIEDVGRTDQSYGANLTGSLSANSYATLGETTNPDGSGFSAVDATPCAGGGTGCHAMWRWADLEAGGGGVSGQAVNRAKFVNGNNNPFGGPTTCTWSTTNCGPNDEPFSFHPGGCNAVFGDGAVHFLSDNMDGRTLRYMVTRDEGTPFTTKVQSQSTTANLITPTTFVGN
jgi:prepilin-type N-terminal cleavage/methylation domain-containing protein/prepilin-type processing-associated H-X9-DG protein